MRKKIDFATFEETQDNIVANKGGRPAKADKALNRCLLYFSDSDFAELEKQARTARKTTNAFLKDIIIKHCFSKV